MAERVAEWMGEWLLGWQRDDMQMVEWPLGDRVDDRVVCWMAERMADRVW